MFFVRKNFVSEVMCRCQRDASKSLLSHFPNGVGTEPKPQTRTVRTGLQKLRAEPEPSELFDQESRPELCVSPRTAQKTQINSLHPAVPFEPKPEPLEAFHAQTITETNQRRPALWSDHELEGHPKPVIIIQKPVSCIFCIFRVLVSAFFRIF